jgi:hypothetical protein
MLVVAYAIPLCALLLLLYIEYRPFGYSTTYILDVGSDADTDIRADIYLVPTTDLSERKIDAEGTTYRELNGIVDIKFQNPYTINPDALDIGIDGSDVQRLYSTALPNFSSTPWKQNIDLRLADTARTAVTGNAIFFDGGMYFDGDAWLETDHTQLSPSQPMSVYVVWKPIDSDTDKQFLIGTEYWGVYQSANEIFVALGPQSGTSDTALRITAPIQETFFNETHTLLMRYIPPDSDLDTHGMIEVYLDTQLIERRIIQAESGMMLPSSRVVSMGWSPRSYGTISTFKGYLYQVALTDTADAVLASPPPERAQIDGFTLYSRGGRIYSVEATITQ